jgi:hypothetical protein
MGEGKEKEEIARIGKFVKEKIVVVKQGYVIKSKGTFNLEDLYMELQIWFEHMGYKWQEIEYKYEVYKNGETNNEMVWVATKDVTKYSTFEIRLSLQAIGNTIEVQMENGAKAKRFKGTLEFRTGADIKRHLELWAGQPFGAYQAKLYEILTRDRLKEERDWLYLEAHKLYDELKAFMMIYR